MESPFGSGMRLGGFAGDNLFLEYDTILPKPLTLSTPKPVRMIFPVTWCLLLPPSQGQTPTRLLDG